MATTTTTAPSPSQSQSQSHCEVIHYTFEAKVKLLDVRDSMDHCYKSPDHPYQISDKYRFEVYSTPYHGSYIYSVDSLRLVDMENFQEIERIDLGIPQDKFAVHDPIAQRIVDELDTIADKSIWYPEDDENALVNAYLKILGDEAYRGVINFDYGDRYYARTLRADLCYNSLIKELKPEQWKSYELDDGLVSEYLHEHGSVDLLAYLAHDLSFMHPILNGSEELKRVYERDVQFGRFYHREASDILFARIMKVDEPFTPDKSISDVMKRDAGNGKYQEMAQEMRRGK